MSVSAGHIRMPAARTAKASRRNALVAHVEPAGAECRAEKNGSGSAAQVPCGPMVKGGRSWVPAEAYLRSISLGDCRYPERPASFAGRRCIIYRGAGVSRQQQYISCFRISGSRGRAWVPLAGGTGIQSPVAVPCGMRGRACGCRRVLCAAVRRSSGRCGYRKAENCFRNCIGGRLPPYRAR